MMSMSCSQPGYRTSQGITGMHHKGLPGDFLRQAVPALADCGFVAPARNEARVVLCDSAGWMPLVGSALGLLSMEERRRAARFRFERDRHIYVLSHALWRMALGTCLSIDAGKIPLTSTAAGQPRLAGTGLSTSLSHSGEWIAIAICAGTTVGVDIECSPSRNALAGLMPAICTPAEITHLMRGPVAEREKSLLALWTRKEALLKAFGVGLNVDPSLFSAAGTDIVPPPPEAAGSMPCRVYQFELSMGLAGALAVPESAGHVQWSVMDAAG